MSFAVVNSLPESELLLIAETRSAALAELSEDELLALETRVRRARTRYVENYRREASARVAPSGGRGEARPRNARNRQRAEVVEDALARVSRAVATAARATAAELKAERLEAARAAKGGQPTQARGAKAATPKTPIPTTADTAPDRKVGDRSTVATRTVRATAQTPAVTARRRARRDAR